MFIRGSKGTTVRGYQLAMGARTMIFSPNTFFHYLNANLSAVIYLLLFSRIAPERAIRTIKRLLSLRERSSRSWLDRSKRLTRAYECFAKRFPGVSTKMWG
jgi:hypothetical protein